MTSKNTLIQVYDNIKNDEELFSFAKFFIKISFLHSFFELLLTLFTIVALILYSDTYQTLIRLTGKVDIKLFVFTFIECIIAFFIFTFLCGFLFYTCIGTNISYKALVIIVMIIGFILYIMVGLLSPYLLIEKGCGCSLKKPWIICFSVIICGLLWGIIGIARFKRINWDCITSPDSEIGENDDTVFRNRRLIAVIVNFCLEFTITAAMLVFFLLAILDDIGNTECNTYLAIYLTIFTMYVKLYYSFEIKIGNNKFGNIDTL